MDADAAVVGASGDDACFDTGVRARGGTRGSEDVSVSMGSDASAVFNGFPTGADGAVLPVLDGSAATLFDDDAPPLLKNDMRLFCFIFSFDFVSGLPVGPSRVSGLSRSFGGTDLLAPPPLPLAEGPISWDCHAGCGKEEGGKRGDGCQDMVL